MFNAHSIDIVRNIVRIATVTGKRQRGKLTTLNIPKNNKSCEIKQIGQLTIGNRNEELTAVRFYDNRAYAVTFERKKRNRKFVDPFYVLDLSKPKKPKIIAEVDDIRGFSEYLH